MTVSFPPVISKANKYSQYLCEGWYISASCLQPWPEVNADEGMSHHKLIVILRQNTLPSPRYVAKGLPNITKMNLFSPLISPVAFDHSQSPVARSSADYTGFGWKIIFPFSAGLSCHLQVAAAASQFLYWEKRWTAILCLPSSAHFIFPTYLFNNFFFRDDETQSLQLFLIQKPSVLCW